MKTCVVSGTASWLAITILATFAIAELGLHLLHLKYTGAGSSALRRRDPRVGGNVAAGDGDEGLGLVLPRGAGGMQLRWRAQRLQ